MTKSTRQLMAGLVMTGLVGAGRSVAAAGEELPAMSRVRSSNPSIVALINDATEHSKTFRALIATINASDGIVYVEEGKCGHGVRACFVAVKKAGANRVLRVQVDMRKADWELMGSIGHELRHTIEVLGERTVVSSPTMYLFYKRIGLIGTERTFETKEAVDAGDAVRNEVRKSRAVAQGSGAARRTSH
jgi:plastocyanin